MKEKWNRFYMYTIRSYSFLLLSKLVVQWMYVHQRFIEWWHSKWISLFRHWADIQLDFVHVFLSKSVNKTFRFPWFSTRVVAWHHRKNHINAIEEISDKNTHSFLECVWNHRFHVWETCGIVIYRMVDLNDLNYF